MRKNLTEFVDEHGQLKAAELLGMTQGALSKALGRGRKIFVEQDEEGRFQGEEVRPFPCKSKSAA